MGGEAVAVVESRFGFRYEGVKGKFQSSSKRDFQRRGWRLP
jgi:hypothetical protein